MKRNRGTAAVLAMIFLAVFAVLGVSLYGMAIASFSTSRNDRDSLDASAAADSGMALFQRVVGNVIMSETQTTGGQAMQKILTGLQTALGQGNASGTLGSQTIGTDLTGGQITQIRIPQFALHSGSAQRVSATISFPPGVQPTDSLPRMYLTVTGSDANVPKLTRVVRVSLVPQDRTLMAFYYGVFARGRVDLADQRACIIGDPPSAGTLGSAYTGPSAIYLHGGIISGDVAVVSDPASSFSTDTTSGSIAGINITDAASLADALTHVRQVRPPTLPPFNPNQFYLSTLTPIGNVSGHTYSDVVITGTASFSGGDVLQGTIYVKPGATVNISGNVTIQGVIVVEDPNLDMSGNPLGTNLTSTSRVNFTGTPYFQPPVWPSGSMVPAAMQQQLDDYSMLAPTAYVYMTGNGGGGNNSGNDPNSGFAKTVVCGTMQQYGSGLVNINDGTLLTMADSIMSGSSSSYSGYYDGDGVRIHRSPGYMPPYGGFIHQFSWVVDQRTYQEVAK